MARNWNIIGSLTSPDARFRRMATRRMTLFWIVMALPFVLVAIALIASAF